MKTRVLLLFVTMATILSLTGCSFIIEQIRQSTPPAGSLALAKDALKAEAERGKFEVSEIRLDQCLSPETTPAEKANGAQVNVWIKLQCATRCEGEAQWGNTYASFHITKVKGVWKTEVIRSEYAGWYSFFPQCPGSTAPEPTPKGLPPTRPGI